MPPDLSGRVSRNNPDGFGMVLHHLREAACATEHASDPQKVFADFAGGTIDIFDLITGEVRAVKLVVAAMRASNYTHAAACPSKKACISQSVRIFGRRRLSDHMASVEPSPPTRPAAMRNCTIPR
jgi:hypothetical protein